MGLETLGSRPQFPKVKAIETVTKAKYASCKGHPSLANYKNGIEFQIVLKLGTHLRRRDKGYPLVKNFGASGGHKAMPLKFRIVSTAKIVYPATQKA